MNAKEVYKLVLRYFFQGLLLIAPVAITVFILVKAFTIIDDLLPFDLFPGAGILILFGLITGLGYSGNTIVGRPVKVVMQEFMNRTPLIKTIYQSINDLVTALVGQKKKFTEPVLVKLSAESNIERLGFVTQSDLHELGITEEKVAVYFPHSYNFSGNLFIVKKENVSPLNAKSAEVMKFIISGGVTTLAEARKALQESEEK